MTLTVGADRAPQTTQPNKIPVIVGLAVTQPNKTEPLILLGWAGALSARPCGSGFLRSGGPLSCAARPRSAARPSPAPPFGAPSPLGRLGAVVGPCACGRGVGGFAAGIESIVMLTPPKRSSIPSKIFGHHKRFAVGGTPASCLLGA